MLFRDTRSPSWPLWFFGIIALAIVLSIGWLVVSLAARAGGHADGNAANSAEARTAVAKTYRDNLAELIRDLQNPAQSVSSIPSRAENALLSMRVPEGLLDAHVAAVLAVRRFETGDLSPDIRADLLATVQSLFDRAEAL